jgi:hypothetical protein
MISCASIFRHQKIFMISQDRQQIYPVCSSYPQLYLVVKPGNGGSCGSISRFFMIFPMDDRSMYGIYIYANIKGVYWWDPWSTIYSSTMDPSWVWMMGPWISIFSGRMTKLHVWWIDTCGTASYPDYFACCITTISCLNHIKSHVCWLNHHVPMIQSPLFLIKSSTMCYDKKNHSFPWLKYVKSPWSSGFLCFLGGYFANCPVDHHPPPQLVDPSRGSFGCNTAVLKRAPSFWQPGSDPVSHLEHGPVGWFMMTYLFKMVILKKCQITTGF